MYLSDKSELSITSSFFMSQEKRENILCPTCRVMFDEVACLAVVAECCVGGSCGTFKHAPVRYQI